MAAADRTDARLWRAAYVANQQEVARQALYVGSTGAARASLRVLTPDDFADPNAAARDLQVLRDRSSNERELYAAIRGLIFCQPARTLSEDTGQFLACEAMARVRQQSETG